MGSLFSLLRPLAGHVAVQLYRASDHFSAGPQPQPDKTQNPAPGKNSACVELHFSFSLCCYFNSYRIGIAALVSRYCCDDGSNQKPKRPSNSPLRCFSHTSCALNMAASSSSAFLSRQTMNTLST